jgi:hypothetical protein
MRSAIASSLMLAIEHLVGAQALAGVSAHDRLVLTGHSFFPALISAPFRHGLHLAFAFAIVACVVAAGASAMRPREGVPIPRRLPAAPLEEGHAG